MIVVDTSALVAVVFAEPEREEFVGIIKESGKALISSFLWWRRIVICGRRGHGAVVMLDDLLRLPTFEWVTPGPAETDVAYAAFTELA